MKAIAEKIRLLRVAKGLSQENIADSLHISTTAYGDIERGKTDLTLVRLTQIAEVLNTTVLGLLSEENLMQEREQLMMKNLQIENDKLRLENQYLREKLAGRMLLDLVREQTQHSPERRKIGF